jgi:hypothetical protein
MRETIAQVFRMRGRSCPEFTSFDLATLNLPAALPVHSAAADYFRMCIPVTSDGPGFYELCSPDAITSENTRYVPGAFLRPFGFVAFATDGSGDAVTLDLTTAEVLIFSHEIDYSDDPISFYGPSRQKIVKPKTRAAIIESAEERFPTLEAFYDDWKRQQYEVLNDNNRNAS